MLAIHRPVGFAVGKNGSFLFLVSELDGLMPQHIFEWEGT